ncbi:hypothetical protein GOODEAATRI_015753 [Goodea atripinnis]|uniref:Uncharacterized protein n=1 Tax=Goodea atripinnis TaxID=208336 RepID=A0ABV0N2M0_9TELE
MFIAGNLLVLLDVSTKQQRYLRSCSGMKCDFNCVDFNLDRSMLASMGGASDYRLTLELEAGRGDAELQGHLTGGLQSQLLPVRPGAAHLIRIGTHQVWDLERINTANISSTSSRFEMEPINELVVGHNVWLSSVVRSSLPDSFIWFVQVNQSRGLLVTGFEDGVVRLLELYNPQRLRGAAERSPETDAQLSNLTTLLFLLWRTIEAERSWPQGRSSDCTVWFFTVGEWYNPIGYIHDEDPLWTICERWNECLLSCREASTQVSCITVRCQRIRMRIFCSARMNPSPSDTSATQTKTLFAP